MNLVIVQGRLVKDPELRYLPGSGMATCSFTVAVDRRMTRAKAAEAKAKGRPTADFIPVVTWDKQAENCANFLAKGKRALVEGTFQTSTSKGPDGNTRYHTNLSANHIEFLDYAEKSDQGSASAESGGSISGAFEAYDSDDDIPF